MPPPDPVPATPETATHTLATNLPLPRIQKKRPRKAPRLTRRPQKRARHLTPEDPEPTLDDELPLPSDAQIAISTLHAAWPHALHQALPTTPPLLLETQLTALVADLPLLRVELRAMLARREVFLIRLPTGDEAYVKWAGISELQKGLLAVTRPGDNIVLATVLAENGFSDEQVTKMVRMGFLTMRDEHSFWLAVPGMAVFVTQRKEGRNEVLGVLKRAQYQEMGLEGLQGRSLKKSLLTAQWVIRDLVGEGVLQTVATSVGSIVRIARVR